MNINMDMEMDSKKRPSHRKSCIVHTSRFQRIHLRASLLLRQGHRDESWGAGSEGCGRSRVHRRSCCRTIVLHLETKQNID